MVSEDRNMVSEDRNMVSEDRNMVSEDRNMVSEDRNMVSEDRNYGLRRPCYSIIIPLSGESKMLDFGVYTEGSYFI
jgi:hypothetical protein